MYWNEIKRIAAAAGFIVGLMTLATNLLRGHTLLHSAYTAVLIMIIASILFLICLRGIGNILTTFLMQKKIEADKEKEIRAKQLAKEKLDELRKRRETLESRTREKIKVEAAKINNENSQVSEKDTAEEKQDTKPEVKTEEKMSA